MRGFFIGGDRGESVVCTAFPDAILKSALDTAFAAGTSMAKKFVKWSTGANFEVTPCADGDVVQGRIVDAAPYVDNSGNRTYILSVEWFWYVDAASAKYPASRITVLPFSGPDPALGTTVAAYSTTYNTVKDATSLGAGRVIAVDGDNDKIAVIQ